MAPEVIQNRSRLLESLTEFFEPVSTSIRTVDGGSCSSASPATACAHPRQCDRNESCERVELRPESVNVHSFGDYVHRCYTRFGGSQSMTTATKRTHKDSQLDSAKIKRAQRALHAKGD